MENTSINEKENKLKLTKTSGFNSTVISDRLVCENKDLKNEFSQCTILSGTLKKTADSERMVHSCIN